MKETRFVEKEPGYHSRAKEDLLMGFNSILWRGELSVYQDLVNCRRALEGYHS